MRYLKVKVRRNECDEIHRSIPPWELPLLQSIHPTGVTVVGEVEVKRAVPPPEVEYERLGRKYREFRDENGDYTGESVVAACYGRFQTGVNALARAIDEATRAATNDDSEGRKGKSEAA